ncbi:MAG: PEP-CTERM sorting domain-containing protein [Planctomycetota bacterium]
MNQALRFAFLTALLSSLAAHSMAGTIQTSFSTADGFTTGSTAPVSLSDGQFAVTFEGGQQQQFFDGPSYNSGPDAYLFINGNFNGAVGTNDTGLIDFSVGVTNVSFFAANRANGAGVTLNVFGIDDTTLLGSSVVTQTDIRALANPTITEFLASDFGGNAIGSIQIDLPGPAANPPYALAIDSFSATAVPEPSTLAFLSLVGIGVVQRRRRRN